MKFMSKIPLKERSPSRQASGTDFRLSGFVFVQRKRKQTAKFVKIFAGHGVSHAEKRV
jgi:hypothetical protein